MLLDPEECQLVLVDCQQRMLPALSDGPAVLANAVRLAQVARLLEVPAWGTEHNAQGLGPTDPALAPLLGRVVPKMSFSAVEPLLPRLRPPARESQGNARSLPKHLRKPAEPATEPRSSIVLAGCETHVCVLQTALELLDEEFEVWVVTDACGSRTERNRDAAFDRLAGAGCELVTTEMVAFEWLRSADHPLFREVLALVK
ncbi:MAG TPA: isochorismatase family protein [Ramlibacter sp.]|jgi:nicotinamidase-related amidase|uniref:isochorismatase family protein n=1 Tax=Ramlibacter sp. TaxID=1917967 RepID=UPI002D2815B5|nr:isochorismatase family protein [Ramlibacter sp.]HZY18680.1 isochorismatase family protein [Ramlibacter sp.]